MKNLIRISFLLLIVSLVGCKKNPSTTPELKLEITPQATISFNAAENAPYQISVSTNLDVWLAAVDKPWCHVTQTVTSITVTADNNELAEPRTATLTISGKGIATKTLSITQAAKEIVAINKAFSFDIPNFSESYVYNIMGDGVKIAEICREYLYKETQIDVQVVTIYPTNDGVTDLSNGFVAKIMLNGEIKNSTIVGGNVSFDKITNSITQFTNGNKQSSDNITINLKDKSIGFTTAPASQIQSNIAELIPYLVADADQNKYPIVKIATQYWMAESMRTTKYNDGTPITNAIVADEWVKSAVNHTGAYSEINTNASNTATYGLLYNAYALGYTDVYSDLSSSDKISPEGWKLPSGWKVKLGIAVGPTPESDMDRLMRYLQGSLRSGASPKMHSPETWSVVPDDEQPPRPYSNNISLFSAKGAGFRSYDLKELGYIDGAFKDFKSQDGWWCSTVPRPTSTPIPTNEEIILTHVECGYIDEVDTELNASYQHKGLGLSVRCLRK